MLHVQVVSYVVVQVHASKVGHWIGHISRLPIDEGAQFKACDGWPHLEEKSVLEEKTEVEVEVVEGLVCLSRVCFITEGLFELQKQRCCGCLFCRIQPLAPWHTGQDQWRVQYQSTR